jgi:hypothetical protein
VSDPYVRLAVVAALSLGYWLLYRRARGDGAALARVRPADWVRVAEALVALPLALGAVLPVALAPFVAGLEPLEAAVSSLTPLAAILGLRAVSRSAELTATRRGVRVFLFRLAWSDVEEVEVGERAVRFRAPRRHRGLRAVEVPISDLGWKVDREVGERLRLLHGWFGPGRRRDALPGRRVA